RLRALGLRSFRDYRNVLTADPVGQEMVEFCNAITTNLTSFFRESHHFDYLRDQVLAPLESLPQAARHDIKILATDLDSDVLSRGRRGVYAEDRVKGMSQARITTFFRE